LGINNPPIQSTLAMLLTQQGRPEEAISHMEEGLRLSPNDVNARINLAGLLASQGRYTEAISQYREALRIEPGNQTALVRLSALQKQRQTPP